MARTLRLPVRTEEALAARSRDSGTPAHTLIVEAVDAMLGLREPVDPRLDRPDVRPPAEPYREPEVLLPPLEGRSIEDLLERQDRF